MSDKVASTSSVPFSKDLILSESAKALKAIDVIRKRWSAEWDSLASQVSLSERSMRFMQLTDKYEKQMPLLHLDECDTDDCPLNREYYPLYRQRYEDEVVAALIKKSEDGEKVTYADFGSRLMFQTMVILAKFLEKKGDAKIDIHLIDRAYECFSTCCDYLRIPRKLYGNVNIDVSHCVPVLIKEKLSPRVKADQSPAVLESYMITESCGNEMIKWLRKNYPQAAVNLWLHHSDSDYFTYVVTRSNILALPDVISASDINDELSVKTGSIAKYASLCINTLMRKKDFENIRLGLPAANVKWICCQI